MVFGAICRLRGFANWLDPMHDRRGRHGVPRMNNWSFWLLIPGALLLMARSSSRAARPARAGRSIRRSSSSRAWRST
jgi:cytochrome c oxidase subunit 1